MTEYIDITLSDLVFVSESRLKNAPKSCIAPTPLSLSLSNVRQLLLQQQQLWASIQADHFHSSSCIHILFECKEYTTLNVLL